MPEDNATTETVDAPVEDAPVEETPVEEAPPVETTTEPEGDIVSEEPAINQLGVFTEDPEPESELEPEPEPEPEQQIQWRNDQYALGAAMGMSVEEVQSFDSPEKFDRVIGGLVQRAAAARAQQQPAQGQQQPAQGQQQPAQGQQQQPAGDYFFAEPEDYDDGVLQMNEHVNRRFQEQEQRLVALQQQNQAMYQQHQMIQAEAAGREMDAIMDTMDENLFGRGRLNSLSQELAENRIKVANAATRDGQVQIQNGEEVPSFQQLISRAANSLFSDQFTKNALAKASKQSRKVAEQSSAVPTRQEDVSDRGYEAAIRAAATWQREHSTLDDSIDSFPS